MQALRECPNARLRLWVVRCKVREHADAPHPLRLCARAANGQAAAALPSSVMNSRWCSFDHLVGAQQE
jgi:hypothetical protein